jgi:hypothetical protein
MESTYSDPSAWTPELGHVGWVYEGDRHVPAVERQKVIMMGFNPGAGRGATQDKLSLSERMWRTRCNKLTHGFCCKPVFAELIHISTSNKKALYEKLGELQSAFNFAARINNDVISYHKPNIIFQAGLNANDTSIFGPMYNLTYVDKVSRPKHATHDLLHHYKLDDGTPWISFIHFARFGFSNNDRDHIRDYATSILSKEKLEPLSS